MKASDSTWRIALWQNANQLLILANSVSVTTLPVPDDGTLLEV
jgi:hypothetical protein